MREQIWRFGVRPVRLAGFSTLLFCAGVVPAAAYSLAGALSSSAFEVPLAANGVSASPVPAMAFADRLKRPVATRSAAEEADPQPGRHSSSAHRIAALSLALGLHSALAPLERTGGSASARADAVSTIIPVARPRAQSIADWRTAQKIQALQAARLAAAS